MRLPPPDPLSLCPLSSTEFVKPPEKKILGTPLFAIEIKCIYIKLNTEIIIYSLHS
jgi:hypothetical protein